MISDMRDRSDAPEERAAGTKSRTSTSAENRPNELLRRQRLQRGWSQEYAADRLHELCMADGQRRKRGDINANMISRWECGRFPTSTFWQEKLQRLYGVSAEELGFIEPLPQHQESLPVWKPSSVEQPRESVVVSLSSEQAQALRFLSRAEDSNSAQLADAWLIAGVNQLAHLFEEGWSVEDILRSLQHVLPGVQIMSKIKRRQLFQLGAAVIMRGIPMPSSEKYVSEEERVKFCRAFGESIGASWTLFHTASNVQVEAVGGHNCTYYRKQVHICIPMRALSCMQA